MRRVFIVQNTMRSSDDRSGLVPVFNFEPARRYGKLEYLLGPSAAPWKPASAIKELTEKLADFDKLQDHLLLSGNPVLLASAFAIAADQTGGTIHVLQWDGRVKGYTSIRVNVFPFDD